MTSRFTLVLRRQTPFGFRAPSKRYQSSSPPSQPPKSNPECVSKPNTPSIPQSAAPPAPEPAVPARSGARSLRERIRAGPVGRLGRSYSEFQDRRPYVTQVCSSVVIYFFGDLSAQFLFPSEEKKGNDSGVSREGLGTGATSGQKDEGEKAGGGYDPLRTLRHLTVGIGSSIPSYNWFMLLHRSFNFTSKFLSILTKVVVQQAVFTPVFNTYFFSVHSLLSGASLAETFERLKVALPQSIVNSAKFWPVVTAFSFMYVPPQFRNVFSGVIAVGWQTYLSWLNQRAAREVEAALTTEPASSRVGNPAAVAIIKA